MRVLIGVLMIAALLFANDTNSSIGEKLYTKHGCYGCHGINAEGTNNFPKLAGKSAYYIKKRLHGYKEDKINSNRANMMKPFAKALSDKEIEILANYLKNLGKKKRENEERYYEDYVVGDSSGS